MVSFPLGELCGSLGWKVRMLPVCGMCHDLISYSFMAGSHAMCPPVVKGVAVKMAFDRHMISDSDCVCNAFHTTL